MKNVRELLLERHRGAVPALDEVRVDVVDALARQSSGREQQAASGWWGVFWQELFVSCRRYWMGLGAAWGVIGFLMVLGLRTDSTSRSLAATASQPVVQAVAEQLRLRAELLGESVVQEARAAHVEPPPGPRSAREPDVAYG